MTTQTSRLVSDATGSPVAPSTPCHGCGERLRLMTRGPARQWCDDCRELRHTCNRLRRVLERRPDLQGMAAVELGVKLVEPGRRTATGGRPAWRNDRIDLYLPFELRAILRHEAVGNRVSLSAQARFILRSWWDAFKGRPVQVLDGEVIGWQDEAA